jgi:hypothetical protein
MVGLESRGWDFFIAGHFSCRDSYDLHVEEMVDLAPILILKEHCSLSCRASATIVTFTLTSPPF